MMAISTTYNGALFRSRLEARWAAMFDLLGWSWIYEPVDLDGYIPDFVLNFYEPLLVEVKPGFSVAELLELGRAKIDASGWTREAMILGATPVLRGYYESLEPNAPCGALRQDDTWWDECRFFVCGLCDKPSVHHLSGTYACRVSGCYDGDHYLGGTLDRMRLWAQAGNAVRWTAP